MRWGNRKLRLALVLTLAVVVAVVAWRTGQKRVGPCEPGRIEERDASGALVAIRRRECPRGDPQARGGEG